MGAAAAVTNRPLAAYWWPVALLELKDTLRLTSEQETRVRALLEAMFAEARPRAARLAEAEARLQRIFAENGAEAGTVRTAVAAAEHARAELRLAHVLTHLRTHDVLTEDQRQLYHRLRWGRAAHQ